MNTSLTGSEQVLKLADVLCLNYGPSTSIMSMAVAAFVDRQPLQVNHPHIQFEPVTHGNHDANGSFMLVMWKL